MCTVVAGGADRDALEALLGHRFRDAALVEFAVQADAVEAAVHHEGDPVHDAGFLEAHQQQHQRQRIQHAERTADGERKPPAVRRIRGDIPAKPSRDHAAIDRHLVQPNRPRTGVAEVMIGNQR